MFGRIATRIAVAALIVLCVQGLLLACPTCKDGIAQTDVTRQNMAQGYFWSILFMMSMPFLILGGLGGYFYWEIRKARQRQQLAGDGAGLNA